MRYAEAKEYRAAWKLCRDEYAELEAERDRLREALRDAAFILREEFGRNTDHLDRLVGER